MDDSGGGSVTLAPGAEAHPILRGVAVAKLIGHGSLYRNTPLEKSATPLLIGTIPGEPAQPVAWTHRHGAKQARVFYPSLGHHDDFQNPEFRRLLANGCALGAQKMKRLPAASMKLILALILSSFVIRHSSFAAAPLCETWRDGYAGADADGPRVLGYWRFAPGAVTADSSGKGGELRLSGARAAAEGKRDGAARQKIRRTLRLSVPTRRGGHERRAPHAGNSRLRR